MTAEVAGAADGMRLQSDEAARGQRTGVTMRGVSAVQVMAKQIKLITKANVEHSTVSHSLLRSVDGISHYQPQRRWDEADSGRTDASAGTRGSSRWPSGPNVRTAARRRVIGDLDWDFHDRRAARRAPGMSGGRHRDPSEHAVSRPLTELIPDRCTGDPVHVRKRPVTRHRRSPRPRLASLPDRLCSSGRGLRLCAHAAARHHRSSPR